MSDVTPAIFADNADIGAAALRRVDALTRVLSDLLYEPESGAHAEAARVLAVEWLPERTRADVTPATGGERL